MMSSFSERSGLLLHLMLTGICWLTLALLPGCLQPNRTWAAVGDDVSVRALVEKDVVAEDEAFLFQIQMQGTAEGSSPAPPDLSGLRDFSVESLGGRANNSSSISIINGRMSKVESYGYVHSFRLTPRKTGQLVIPSIPVPLDPGGKNILKTQPVSIRVTRPETSEDFQLQVEFSKTRFYVGEPVTVTVTWYLNRDVKEVDFTIPVLETDGLRSATPRLVQEPGKQYVQIPLGQDRVLAEKERKVFKGREYTAVSFRKVLFAERPGTFPIPESTVSCKVVTGYSRSSQPRGSPFDHFFNDDFFHPERKEIKKTFVARSQAVGLTVLPLPGEGRPADFSGCVGTYTIEATAAPTDVSVGDPITLNVVVRGGPYLENVELPSLAADPEIERNFKVPEEMAAGTIKDGGKVFTQTLRARSEDVKAVPPIRFSSFDPEKGVYRTVATRPIPLRVKPTRVVTEADIEGRASTGRVKNELEAWSEGIAYNYEGPELLENQGSSLSSLLRSPLWLTVLLAPAFVYLLLFVVVKIRRSRMADPLKMRSRKALATFSRGVGPLARPGVESGGAPLPDGADPLAALLDALRCFLGDKLGMDGAALTFPDVEKHLRERGIGEDVLRKLDLLFSICEEGRYGGGAGPREPLHSLVAQALEVAGTLDRTL